MEQTIEDITGDEQRVCEQTNISIALKILQGYSTTLEREIGAAESRTKAVKASFNNPETDRLCAKAEAVFRNMRTTAVNPLRSANPTTTNAICNLKTGFLKELNTFSKNLRQ